MKKMDRKKKGVIFSVFFIGAAILLTVPFIPLGEEPDLSQTTNVQSYETAGSHAFSDRQHEDLNELIAHSDNVILGTVVDVSKLDRYTDEYVLHVVDQFKGEIASPNIYVYEHADRLEIGESYVMFLAMTIQSYVDHPIYTSEDKESILHVVDNKIKTPSPLVDNNMTFDQLKPVLLSSPGRTKIATTDHTRGHATVVQEPLSLDELIEESHVIAQAVPEAFPIENKYNKLAKFNIIKTYRNTSGIEITDTTLFIMPAELQLDTEYLVFLQNHDGAFYTVSRVGSLIRRDEPEIWEQALNRVEELENRENHSTSPIN